MKRSLSFSTSFAVAATTLLAAAPAFGREVAGGDDFSWIFSGGVCAIWACIAVFALLSLALWVWMLVDVIAREEYEFPNSTGNSKVIWLIVMLGSFVLGVPLIAAIVYYFMVYTKIKRGSGSVAGPPGGYQQSPPPPPPVAPPAAPPAPPVAPERPAPPAPPVAPAPPAPAEAPVAPEPPADPSSSPEPPTPADE